MADKPTSNEAPRRRYITKEGHARFGEEMRQLWNVERRKVVAEVQAAAAQGDRSENAEYIYGKKLLREIDRRVRFLVKRLEELKVVDTLPTDPSRIYFGAWVEIEDAASGEVLRLRIVGPDETDAGKGWISIDAPVARALLKKAVDDEVAVERPAGKGLYYVLAVRYTPFADSN